MVGMITVDVRDDVSYTIEIKPLGPVNPYGVYEYSVAIDGNVLDETLVSHVDTGTLELLGYAIEIINKTEED